MKTNMAKELIRIAKLLKAIDFDSREAMKKYLKEHPAADKGNHRVIENKIQKVPEKVDKIQHKQEWAKKLKEKNVVPEDYYVHGRAKRQDLNTGSVIQMTKNWDVSEQYAGKNGSEWLIRPKQNAKIMDMTDYKVLEKIKDKMFKQLNEGKSSIVGDIEGFLGKDREVITEEDIENAVESFNPKDIVNSAEAYDNQDWIEWLMSNFNPSFVITEDGAVGIDLRDLETIKVPK